MNIIQFVTLVEVGSGGVQHGVHQPVEERVCTGETKEFLITNRRQRQDW